MELTACPSSLRVNMPVDGDGCQPPRPRARLAAILPHELPPVRRSKPRRAPHGTGAGTVGSRVHGGESRIGGSARDVVVLSRAGSIGENARHEADAVDRHEGSPWPARW